jgi:hypothetical protein
MPEPNAEHWYAIYADQNHVGHMRVIDRRDDEGVRHLEQTVHLIAQDGVTHDATSLLRLLRKDGRYVPLGYRYKDTRQECNVEFKDGRIAADGSAADHDGALAPGDVMPTYGVQALASCIFNQPSSQLTFTPMTDSDASLGKGGCRLVCRGQAEHEGELLWEVIWLNAAGTRIQAFYFDDKAVMRRADWGGTRARLVEHEALARAQAGQEKP